MSATSAFNLKLCPMSYDLWPEFRKTQDDLTSKGLRMTWPQKDSGLRMTWSQEDTGPLWPGWLRPGKALLSQQASLWGRGESSLISATFGAAFTCSIWIYPANINFINYTYIREHVLAGLLRPWAALIVNLVIQISQRISIVSQWNFLQYLYGNMTIGKWYLI